MAKRYKQGSENDSSLVPATKKHSTDKAYLLENEDGDQKWFPKSKVYPTSDSEDEWDIPNWLLDKVEW